MLYFVQGSTRSTHPSPKPGVMDVSVVKKFLLLGKLTGYFPCKYDDSSCIFFTMVNILGTLIKVFLMTFLTICFQTQYTIHKSEMLLSFANQAMMLSFSATCTYSIIRYQNIMVKFFENVSDIDEILKFKSNESPVKLKMIYFLLSALIPMTILLDGNNCQNILWCSFSITTLTMQLQTIYLIACTDAIANLLQTRYEKLRDVLRCQGFTEMADIKKVVHLLKQSVDEINKLFGMPILVIILYVFVLVLIVFDYCVLFILEPGEALVTVMTTALSLGNGMCFFISAIILIRGWDRIEKLHAEVLLVCMELQVESDESTVKRGIFLQKYIENLSPKFIVAGFLHLNQNLFAKFCSYIVSYLIMLLQFKMSTNKITHSN